MSRLYGEECEFDYPMSNHMQPSESLIIFDDVFVPWERVFMCGEWQFSQILAYAFASYHRLFGTCKMTGTLEIMTGAASLIAEYNGVQNVPHVRKKLAWMAMITETVQMLGKQACLDPVTEFGMDVMMPNRMAINASKFTYASNFHQMCQHMQDIGGGLTTTVPAFRDWKNPEIQPYIEKYLAAKDGVPTEDRISHLAAHQGHDRESLAGRHHSRRRVHGRSGDVSICQRQLEKTPIGGETGGPKLTDGRTIPFTAKLPLQRDFVKMPAVDESYKSIAPTAKK